MVQIKRGGYASTYARQEEIEEIRRKSTAQQTQQQMEELKLIKTNELQQRGEDEKDAN
jgi:hypothetical protein